MTDKKIAVSPLVGGPLAKALRLAADQVEAGDGGELPLLRDVIDVVLVAGEIERLGRCGDPMCVTCAPAGPQCPACCSYPDVQGHFASCPTRQPQS